jgi:hypothetical protein
LLVASTFTSTLLAGRMAARRFIRPFLFDADSRPGDDQRCYESEAS